MALRDVRNIIQTVPISYVDQFEKNIDNIMENYIIYNNNIHNTYIMNDIMYKYKNINIQQIIDIIIKYINTNIKNQRNIFRELNKKNNLFADNYNNYFDNMYRLFTRLSGMVQHIVKTVHNENMKWGNNIIITNGIESIIKNILDDTPFKYTITRSIKTPKSIIKLNNFIKTFSQYFPDYNIYKSFIDCFDNAIFNTIPNIDYDVDINMMIIYQFKITIKHFFENYYCYYMITNNNKLTVMTKTITEILQNIIAINDINIIANFINVYKYEIMKIMTHIDVDIGAVLLSKKPDNIDTFINYYSCLYEISKDNKIFKELITKCITDNIKTNYSNTDSIILLTKKINSDILNKKLNEFYYIIGSYMTNKDEFILYLSQKLIERIIYTTFNIDFETNHFNAIKKAFNNDHKLFYRYKNILNDYDKSSEFNKIYTDKYIKLLITTYDIWKVNIKAGSSDNIINIGNFTSNLCSYYEKYYEVNLDHTLITYPHLGYVNVTINKTVMDVLPAHMFCLELFCEIDDKKSYSHIYDMMKVNMSNYSDEFIKKIIDSLVIGNVLILSDNMYHINNMMDQYIDMIYIFHNMDNVAHSITEIVNELAHDRTDIVAANINHYVKLNKYNINDLYEKLKNEITHFKLDRTLYDDTIQMMGKKEYITIVNDMIIKEY